MEGTTAEDPTLFPATVGEKLRSAREALTGWAGDHAVELA